MKGVHRELLLSFWKLHILHHARAAAINGQWILAQLRRHGCEISPGTLYPLLPPLEETAYLFTFHEEGFYRFACSQHPQAMWADPGAATEEAVKPKQPVGTGLALP